MSNYCPKGHWEDEMKLPCKQCQIEYLRAEVSRLTAELSELSEQKPVAKLVVRMETHDMGQSLAPNPPFKFASARANASAEELPLGEYPLYARPIPAAQAVPELTREIIRNVACDMYGNMIGSAQYEKAEAACNSLLRRLYK